MTAEKELTQEVEREFEHFRLIDGSDWLSEDPDTLEKLKDFVLKISHRAYLAGRQSVVEEIVVKLPKDTNKHSGHRDLTGQCWDRGYNQALKIIRILIASFTPSK